MLRFLTTVFVCFSAIHCAHAEDAYPPYGWLAYCATSKDETCKLNRTFTPTDLAWVDASVDGQFTADPDPLDEWGYAPADKVGDCDEYVLTKRAVLLSLGMPPGAMTLVTGDAEVMTADGPQRGPHMVLHVQLGTVTWILDNLSDRIYTDGSQGYAWTETGRQVHGEIKWKATPPSTSAETINDIPEDNSGS